MAIRLNDIKNIANIVKTKYGNDLHRMNFVFCFKKGYNSYFIFQEIQGMPIKRVVYHDSNNSVSFVASWSSWSNPFSLVADANYEKIEAWKDLQDRTRAYNSYIEIDGGFNSSCWNSVDKKNKTEINKKHKNKSDSFFEFRIDKVERAFFNENCFELYSPTISMIGFRLKSNFPYNFEDDGSEYQNEVNLIDNGLPAKITWQGRSFIISDNEMPVEDVSQVSNPLVIGGGCCDLSSYWEAKVKDDDYELFDEELAQHLLDDREIDDSILDIGQKRIDLDFGD